LQGFSFAAFIKSLIVVKRFAVSSGCVVMDFKLAHATEVKVAHSCLTPLATGRRGRKSWHLWQFHSGILVTTEALGRCYNDFVNMLVNTVT